MNRKVGATFRWLGTKAKIIAAVIVLAVLGGWGAVVMAAIPDSAGVIHSCRTTLTGAVRVIDSASQSCNSLTETALNWDQNKPSIFVSSLSGADLSYGDLRYRNFVSTDLSSANLQYAKLKGADFTSANLTGADLQYTDAAGATFTGATFSGSVLGGTNMKQSDLASVNLSGLGMWGVDFKGADLSSANLSNGGSFSGSDFSSDSTYTTSLASANFTNAAFDGVNFTGTSLSSATLTGVTWHATYCPDATYSDDNGNTCTGHLNP